MQRLIFFTIFKQKNVDNDDNKEAKGVTRLYTKFPILKPIDACMARIEDLHRCTKRMRDTYVNTNLLHQRKNAKRRRKLVENNFQNQIIKTEMAKVKTVLECLMVQLSAVCEEHELNYPSISLYEHGCVQDSILVELHQNAMNGDDDAKVLYSICQKIVCEPSFKWRCIDHNGVYNLLNSEGIQI